MIFIPWNVYVIFIQSQDKDKICVCFHSDPSAKFFYINSFQYQEAEFNIKINPSHHQAITRLCYLNLNQKVELPDSDLTTARDRGPLPKEIIDSVRPALMIGPSYLSERHKNMAISTLPN